MLPVRTASRPSSFVMARSACVMTDALAVLFCGFGSGSDGSRPRTLAVLTLRLVDCMVATRSKLALPPFGMVPTVHTPVFELYAPWVTKEETNASPAGSWSSTDRLVAAAGPAFRAVTVKVTCWPTSGPGSSTVLQGDVRRVAV